MVFIAGVPCDEALALHLHEEDGRTATSRLRWFTVPFASHLDLGDVAIGERQVVRGVVRDRTGSAVAGAVVALRELLEDEVLVAMLRTRDRADALVEDGPSTLSDEAGRFNLAWRPRDGCALVANVGSGLIGVVELDGVEPPGEARGINIVAQEGRSVRGTALRRGAAPSEALRVVHVQRLPAATRRALLVLEDGEAQGETLETQRPACPYACRGICWKRLSIPRR